MSGAASSNLGAACSFLGYDYLLGGAHWGRGASFTPHSFTFATRAEFAGRKRRGAGSVEWTDLWLAATVNCLFGTLSSGSLSIFPCAIANARWMSSWYPSPIHARDGKRACSGAATVAQVASRLPRRPGGKGTRVSGGRADSSYLDWVASSAISSIGSQCFSRSRFRTSVTKHLFGKMCRMGLACYCPYPCEVLCRLF